MIGLSDIKTGIDILEKLTGWVRDLRARLTAARSTQTHLAEALVEQAA